MPAAAAKSLSGARPDWLTFDCYGTLTQWDEGVLAAVTAILARHGAGDRDARAVIAAHDAHEHRLEQTPPHRSFREVSAAALAATLGGMGLACEPADAAILTEGISAMPPFPEVPATLARLKAAGFRLCIISNTDDDLIAGNVAQMGGHIDRVVTAQQARAYKPSPRIFAHAHEALGVTPAEIVHICASPHLDHAAARDVGFRCVWVDRGSGRAPLPDYSPDAVVHTLDEVIPLFSRLGWMPAAPR